MVKSLLTSPGLALTLLPASLAAQFPSGELLGTPTPDFQGWEGFTDLVFLRDTFLTLALAAVLGAIAAYHPRRIRTADTLEEIEAPKVSIVYAVVGALIGILVLTYGMYVGFVLFGMGALFRFRSVMRSAQLTGQVIFITLVGLTCGLDLPHVAVLAIAFDYVLTFILETRITYSVEVRGLEPAQFTQASEAYREALKDRDYRILSEKKMPDKGRITFIFRTTRSDSRKRIEAVLDERVHPQFRGSLNWEID